jgi:hypothetical protein
MKAGLPNTSTDPACLAGFQGIPLTAVSAML